MFKVTKNGKPLDKSLYTLDKATKTFSSNEDGLVIECDNRWTIKAGSNCTFKTGSYCTFDTASYCDFKTGYCCTFDTGTNCTFTTKEECVVVRRDEFMVIKSIPDLKWGFSNDEMIVVDNQKMSLDQYNQLIEMKTF